MKNNETKLLIGRMLAMIMISLPVATFSLGQNTSDPQQPSAKTGYAPVHGLKMYYEVRGSGRPLVLLHGAFNTIDLAFGMLIPELSKTRQVIAVEMQGHGRTADNDRPFSFQTMADDVAALLKYLKTERTVVI